MRWMTIACLACLGCVPRLDDCAEDDDCPTPRRCSSGYCLPVDAAVTDAAAPDQRVVDAMLAGDLGLEVDADLPDATVPDAAPDRGVDAGCSEGATEACPPELGVCDPGERVCRGGAWSACEGRVVTAETCSGTDDDCDGRVDEGFDVGGACESGLGVCRRMGVLSCAEGAATCSVAAADPEGPEACTANGALSADEDCDGRVDEGIGTGVSRLGAPVAVGRDATLAEDFMRPTPLDLAVTDTHTAILTRVAGDDDALQVRIYAHVEPDAFGRAQVHRPFVEAVSDVSLATRGRRFVVVGKRAPVGDNQTVEVHTIDPDGEPVVAGDLTSQFPSPVNSLRVVDSAADRVIFFAHVGVEDTVRRRAYVDNMAVADVRLPYLGALGEWDVAARGDESFLMWRQDARVTYRRYVGPNVRDSIVDPLPAGRPTLILSDDPYVSTVDDEGRLEIRRIVGDRVVANTFSTGLVGVPGVGSAALGGRLLFSALGNGGGVVSLYTPDLQRTGVRFTLPNLSIAPVVATRGTRGSVVWVEPNGEISMQAIWTGCASLLP